MSKSSDVTLSHNPNRIAISTHSGLSTVAPLFLISITEVDLPSETPISANVKPVGMIENTGMQGET